MVALVKDNGRLRLLKISRLGHRSDSARVRSGSPWRVAIRQRRSSLRCTNPG